MVLATEFAHTPRINGNAFMLGGAGIRSGIYSDNFEGTPRQAAVLDQAMSALLADLHANRLLDETLVVVGTEFGCKTRMNDTDGREQHH